MSNPNRPTVPEVLPMVRSLYERHLAGCCLHIVLDDGNVEDSSVSYCLEFSRTEGHTECEELALKLLAMSRTQRLKLGRLK